MEDNVSQKHVLLNTLRLITRDLLNVKDATMHVRHVPDPLTLIVLNARMDLLFEMVSALDVLLVSF